MHRIAPPPQASARSTHRSGTAAGFTLVEIMVVIVILGLLAGLVVQSVVPAGDAARNETARTNCVTIAGAVKLYRTSKGRLPDSLDVLAASSERSQVWFLENLPRDPWDRDYELHAGATEEDWQVRSCGRDGVGGTDDDICNRDTLLK